MESAEQVAEFMDPALLKTPLPPDKLRRVLTTVEKAMFDKLGSMQWIANCQPPPPRYCNPVSPSVDEIVPDRVINYLSNYVRGNVISDRRIIDTVGCHWPEPVNRRSQSSKHEMLFKPWRPTAE